MFVTPYSAKQSSLSNNMISLFFLLCTYHLAGASASDLHAISGNTHGTVGLERPKLWTPLWRSATLNGTVTRTPLFRVASQVPSSNSPPISSQQTLKTPQEQVTEAQTLSASIQSQPITTNLNLDVDQSPTKIAHFPTARYIPPDSVWAPSDDETIQTDPPIKSKIAPVDWRGDLDSITPLVPTNARNRSINQSSHTADPPKPIGEPSQDNSNGHLSHHSSGSVHPLLIYSMRYEIRCFDLYQMTSARASGSPGNIYSATSVSGNHYLEQQISHHHTSGKQSRTLMGGLKNTIGLDFYYSEHESYIFWTDVIDERIYRGTIIDGTITNVIILVQGGLATAEGLAIDWVGHNVYWVESTLDHIEVASMNGTNRKTLIAGEMESPRAIAVDPRYGYLFWTDWDKSKPRIERALMNGEDRRTLVYIKEVNGGWPNGLTLDYDMLKVYWIDANSDSIHVVDYDGNDHQIVLNRVKSLGHPFSITLYENNLYWTDWKTNSVSMANKNVGVEAKELQRSTSRLFDIKVFHPSRQPKVEANLNPCSENNGNCSHLCLLKANHTRKCECPNLMKISSDGLKCQPDENLLLIGRANEIRAVDINEPLYHIMAPISVPKVFNPRQFAFDAKSKTIFWVDAQTNEVKRVQITSNNIETIIDVIVETPSGLALDWISGNIYVTSAPQYKLSSGRIYISNLNGEYISVLMDGNQGIISPKSLAVHPVLGLLFCIDENESLEPIIFAAGMDGKNKRVIASKLNNPRLENPSNLAMDFELNRVYWINQASNTSIQYYDIVLDKIETVFDESHLKPGERSVDPRVLCIDGDSLIMSSKDHPEMLIKASKLNFLERTQYKTPNTDQILALSIYNASSQTGSNSCSANNGNCSQLCVPTNSTHRACKCTMGYSINPNDETDCIGKNQFLIFSYNLGMKGISLEPGQVTGEHYLPPIHKAFRASSIDFVHRDSLIYWVDNEEGSITKINRDTTNYKVIIQGLESEESIAIDWVASNIYWLDPYYNIIEVARLNGSSRYVIVSGDMDKANGIVVNPIKGYIVWSDIGQVPKIEVADLDGGNRRVIASKSFLNVDDLAIDLLGDFIYWVDSTRAMIERVKADGSNRQIIFTGDSAQNHLVSIAIYKDYLFIADSAQHGGSIIRCNKSDVIDKQILQQSLGDGIRDITVYADQPMPSPEENPCVRNNGNCQDLCIFSGKPGQRRCICAHGRLRTDGTCEPYDTFVLYSKLSQIESLHIRDDESFLNSPYPAIQIENRSNIISLTVDYKSSRVIYSEITRDQICSVYFNGTDRRVLVDRQSFVEGIAFANDQLYWTSIHDYSISRLNTTSSGPIKPGCTGPSCRSNVEKIVALSSDDKPRGIAVDSCSNYIYWTNWNLNASSIQRASPHTGYKIESIIKTNIKVPNGIAIDQKQRRLYWCDARLDKIETCDMDGSNRIILVSASPQHPFALAIWENYVFWTDWLARGVFRADKYTGQQLTQVKKVLQRPMGIAIAAPDSLDCPIDRCLIANGGCKPDEVCKARYSIHEVECIPRSLLVDQRTFGISTPSIRTYHDIIMNPLDRYNLSDTVNIQPIATESKYHSTVMESPSRAESTSQLIHRISTVVSDNVANTSSDNSSIKRPQKMDENQGSRNKLMTSTPKSLRDEVLVNITIPSAPASPTLAPTIAKSSTQQSTIDETAKTNESTTSESDEASAPTITDVSLVNLTSLSSSSTLTKSPDNISVTSNQQVESQLNSSTTLPPCQFVPAALQPTTDLPPDACDPKGQFRCYLPEKAICIPIEKKCDGSYDCPSKEDESDCYLSKSKSYNFKRETNWFRFVTVISLILVVVVAALFLVFGTKGRRRWFVCNNTGFGHRRMFDDNGTNIEISNPMFDEDDGNLVHCAFSIDLNERTTNFSNPLYERQVLLMNDKNVTAN